MRIPSEIKEIIGTLATEYEVYYIGGCVRDTLIGRNVHDYDCTTNATVEEMKQSLSCFKIIETGIRHGTLTVLNRGYSVEITTYRTDKKALHHRQAEVSFTRSLSEDLKRRDFTINALACDIHGNLIDEHNGLHDLKHRILRCIGDPIKRFDEDALRILRAVRFAHTLRFEIEPLSKQAIYKQLPLLNEISIERRIDELMEILADSHPHAYNLLKHYQLLPYFYLKDKNINEQINQINFIEGKVALLFDNETEARHIMRKWHCSKQLIHQISVLIRSASLPLNNDDYTIRKLLYDNHNQIDWVRKILHFNHLDTHRLEHIFKTQDYLIQLAVNGKDCQKLGFEGPLIAQILDDCVNLVLHDPILNQKELLTNYIRQKWSVLL